MKRWKINKPDEKLAVDFSKKCDLTQLVLKVMVSRKYTEFEQIVEFFSEQELSDPFSITDMQEAVDTISAAVDSYDLICIYGDYDCDGITSIAILYNYLESMGANVMYYIPERSEGYGLNSKAINKIAEMGVQLIITVDNGISAHSEAEEIADLGMKLVITDHHQPSETLPKAAAVVNPHRADCTSVYKDFAGVGVAFKLCAALDGGNYDVILEQYSDICAIGTVGDIVPLTGENRTIVKNGLRYLKNTENPGLNYLMDKTISNRDKINSTAIAFNIVPKINASSRLGSPLTAVKAILSEDDEDAENYVDTLLTLNNQRKDAEAEIMNEIFKTINENPDILNQRAIILSGKGWHLGIIGIIASRVLKIFGKTSIILSVDENGMVRGSARSVDGFNVFDCFTSSKDLLLNFGGHECAGGLSLIEENIEQFKNKVFEYANALETTPLEVVNCDMVIMPQDITIDNVKSLSCMEPFGEENPQPVFALIGAKITQIIPLSQGKHTKLFVNYGGVDIQAPLFSISPSDLNFAVNDIVDIAAKLEINEYNGKISISANVIDIRKKGINQEKYFAAKDCYEKYMLGKELPNAFLERINPQRNELVGIYKYINSVKEISVDDLYIKLNNDAINYCKLRICIDIFESLGLVRYEPYNQKVTILPVTQKVDLENSKVLIELRSKICK